MRILVHPGDWGWRNLGDTAMAQVAIRRLRRLWPEARLDVMSNSGARLERFCPGTFPVPADGQWRWLGDGQAFGGPLYKRLVPGRVRVPAGRAEAYVRRHWPRLAAGPVRLAERRRLPERRTMTAFYEALVQADLVVLSGAHDLTSAFEPGALRILALLRLAHLLGKPTVLFGQGLGPIRSEKVLRVARTVLPRAELIAVRERRTGVPLLEKIGVDRARVMVTGDDALELAAAEEVREFGDGIGINIRCAPYSAVDRMLVATLRPVLHEAARRLGVALVPAPVLVERIYDIDSDVETIGRLLEGFDGRCEGGQTPETPQQLIKQIGQCRLVVTGSYHAAVFALGQGIPAIGLAKTEYYADKFLGLRDMFDGGCEVVYLDQPDAGEQLGAAIQHAWQTAEQIRVRLREAAARQIESSRAAYERCHALLQARGAAVDRPTGARH